MKTEEETIQAILLQVLPLENVRAYYILCDLVPLSESDDPRNTLVLDIDSREFKLGKKFARSPCQVCGGSTLLEVAEKINEWRNYEWLYSGTTYKIQYIAHLKKSFYPVSEDEADGQFTVVLEKDMRELKELEEYIEDNALFIYAKN